MVFQNNRLEQDHKVEVPYLLCGTNGINAVLFLETLFQKKKKKKKKFADLGKNVFFFCISCIMKDNFFAKNIF